MMRNDPVRHESGSNGPANSGFALITALLLVTVLAVLLISYFTTTAIELSSTKSTADQTTGFYAAEGGLNVRGERIRLRFDNYGIPAGLSPDLEAPCLSGSVGSGDFACDTMSLQGRDVVTYVLPGAENGELTIPVGEPFAGLNALENTFSVFSRAAQAAKPDEPEALLQMIFRNRLVPLFQFAVFYDKDLEIMPGALMTLSGRVHVNGDLYMGSANGLEINGQVTSAVRTDGTGGDIYRIRKSRTGTCEGGAAQVRVHNGSNLAGINCPNPLQSALQQSFLGAWNGRILTRQDRLVVPPVESFEVGGEYWTSADLRIGLDAASGQVSVYKVDLVVGSGPVINSEATAALTTCMTPGGGQDPSAAHAVLNDGSGIQAVERSKTFRNNREGKLIDMLEVNMEQLLACLADPVRGPILLGSPFHPGLGTTEKGGFVMYLTVIGAKSNVINNYGVRLRNGTQLDGVKGLTVVTDQALYVQGDYNLEADWKPASFIADSFNVLSKAFDENDHDERTRAAPGSGGRIADGPTTVNAAVMAGTDTTGCVGEQDVAQCAEGTGGQGTSDAIYNGGLENYPRLHEKWTGVKLKYRGSFVSLGRPQRVSGKWQGNYYDAAVRDWDYDTRFNQVENLPPMTPRASYLVQERFSRDFLDQ